MVARKHIALGLLLGLVLGGCVVKETREDILKQAWRCEDDVDCTAGWQCRYFAFDPDQQKYCVKPCASDADCQFGDVCANDGFCVQPCDLTAPSCRDPKFACQRVNMTPGDTAGYCQPTDPCDASSECGAPFDQCLGPVLGAFFDDLTLDGDQSICLDSCAGKDCAEGYSCVRQVLQGFLPSESVPQVCVPRCGENNSCPNGFRCFLDALQEWFPDTPFDEDVKNLTKVCVPGLSGLGLPCRTDLDCLTGRCVRHPNQSIKGGGDYYTCALPCDADGTCEDVRTDCLQTQYQGQTSGFCFQPFKICASNDDCVAPQECIDFSNVKAGQICATPCSGLRDPTTCQAGFTCIPEATGTRTACYFGFPGFPCDNDNQCHQGYGEGTTCLGPSSAPSQTLCTKSCTTNADCTFGRAQGAAPLCLQGVCRTPGFGCDDATMPYECNGGLQCANVFGDVGTDFATVCTVPCPGPRVTGHGCPRQFTCAPLLQSWSPYTVESYCIQGFPGLMPCRQDSECLDVYRDGSQRCVSITGADLAVDGTCSVPCASQEDCSSAVDDAASIFCLPGAPDPDAGQPGLCYANASFDVILGVNLGRQGTFCNPSDPRCEAGLDCVPPYTASAISLQDMHSRYFCAAPCNTPADCPQTPVPHDCVGDANGSDSPHCRPAHSEYGLGFKAPCLDPRECAWGVCYREAEDDVYGLCTKVCERQQDCQAPEFPDSLCGLQKICTPTALGQ